MPLYKNKYRTESARWQEWNYASSAAYFVTICTRERQCILGEIKGEEMVLSGCGKIISEVWKKIPKQFEDVELDEFVIMPNHIHGIIIIRNDDEPHDRRDTIHRVSAVHKTHSITGLNNPMLYKNSLPTTIRWFKGRVKFEISKNITSDFAWQPGYYDHVVGEDESFERIREYINDNPLKWALDEENPAVFMKRKTR